MTPSHSRQSVDELEWHKIGTAFALWQAGYDTGQIAKKLRTTEAAIYNGLWRFKQAMNA